jgi:chemotaxis protein CheD
MHCARNGWGGIFHALLPRIGDYSKPSSPADPYRYVDSSIMELLRECSRAGIYPDSLECKVFGGASPLHQDSDVSAGKRNVEAAMETLARAGVTVSASSVGGNVGRKLFFRTDTGLVLQKRFLVRPGKEAAR